MSKLIDADNLRMEGYFKWFDRKCTDRDLVFLNVMIEEQPTVDAEPVRHGHWIYTGIRGRFPVCECSCCGNAESADWALIGDNVNYCPHCGARMDENETD